MPRCFNITYIKRGPRHWLVLPGLLGLADDLAVLLPPSDSLILINYQPNTTMDYMDEIESFAQYLESNFRHLNSLQGIGYSLGGRLLFSLTMAMPKLISGAVYISSGFPLRNPKDRYNKYKFNRLVSHKLNANPPSEFLNWWYQLPIYKGLVDHPKFNQMIQEKTAYFDPVKINQLLQGFNSLNMSFSSPSCTPSLYLNGELDQKYHTIATQFVQQFLSDVTVVSIPNASHLCHWESPLLVQESIKQWAA